MSVSPIGLLKTRRLWPLALTQSCGALNDNLVKNAMVVLALFQLGIGGAGLSALAGALFIAPYILLSATAGKLADRFSKPRVILVYKVAELLLMAAAAAAFLTESVPGLLVVLTGLGVQATLFGPVKYGLLPEHLAEDELVAGNGVIEATTFLSIVCGTVAGGALVLLPHGTAWVGAAGMALSLLGLFAAMQDPAVAGRRSVAAHHAEPVRRDLARGAPCRGDPSDLALGPRPVLVLDHRRHADDRVPRGGARHAGVRRHRAHAAAVGVRHRRRRRLHAVRAAAARRGVARGWCRSPHSAFRCSAGTSLHRPHPPARSRPPPSRCPRSPAGG